MQLVISPLADAGIQVLAPDIVWNGTSGDFAMAAGSADGGALGSQAGGLQAQAPIATAVIMLLFSDAQADVSQLRFEHRGDRRGWPGDGFDIDTAAGEAPLGSLLWLFRRSTLSDLTASQVAAEAKRALQPLITQRLVNRINTRTEIDKAAGQLRLGVDLYGRDGRKTYAAQYDVLWQKPPPY